MAIAEVEALKAQLKDQPVSPLRPPQIEEYRAELARLGDLSEGRDMDGERRAWLPGDKSAASQRARKVRAALDAQSAKKITGERANTVKALAEDVLERVIKPGLLPRSVMRRNPAGAVGQVLKTEFHREFKDAVLTWKRAMRGLDPEERDPDFTNIERFRAEGTVDGTSTFMADAQIRGHMALTPRAKANFDAIDWNDPAIRAQLDAAGVTVIVRGAPKPAPVSTRQDYRCEDCDKDFTGRGSKQNYERHMTMKHKEAAA